MNLCETCLKDWLAWSSYRPVHPIRIHTVGGSARDALDAARLRTEDYYALVRSQHALIKTICATKHRARGATRT